MCPANQTNRFQKKHWIAPNIRSLFLPPKTSLLDSVFRHSTYAMHLAWLLVGRYGYTRAARLSAFTVVFVAISCSAVTVALNIESANGALGAGVTVPAADKSVPRPKVKPVHVESLLPEPDLPQCGYGKVENMMSGSCEWATRTTLGEAADDLTERAVSEILARVVKLYQAGAEKQARAALEEPLLEGHPKAQALAALFFHEGDLLEQDRNKALELIKLSAAQKEPRGQLLLAKWLIADCTETCPNIDRALVLLRMASDAGLHDATEEIGRIYYDGVGMPQNREAALPYIKTAAEAGKTDAQRVLGTMLHNGEHAPKSHELALEWLTKAARQGDPNAMAKVGVMHLLGRGTEQNITKGLLWTWFGARKGEREAQYLIGTLLIDEVEGILERTQGLMWLRVAASRGHGGAREMLGNLQPQIQYGEETLSDIAVKACHQNMKKCGSPPWEWEGFSKTKSISNRT